MSPEGTIVPGELSWIQYGTIEVIEISAKQIVLGKHFYFLSVDSLFHKMRTFIGTIWMFCWILGFRGHNWTADATWTLWFGHTFKEHHFSVIVFNWLYTGTINSIGTSKQYKYCCLWQYLRFYQWSDYFTLSTRIAIQDLSSFDPKWPLITFQIK